MPPATGAIATAGEPSDDDIRLFKALTARTGKKSPAILQFSDEELTHLAQYVIRDFEDADAASRPYKQHMAEMLMNWRGTTEPKDFPFAGASNIVVPFTSVVIEQMVARLMKAIFGGDLWSKIQLLDEQVDTETIEEANQWWQWELEEIVKLKEMMRHIIHDVLVVGISTPIPSYRHDTRMLHSMRAWEFDVNQSLGTLIETACQQIIDERSPWGIETPMQVGKQTKPGMFDLMSPDPNGKMENRGHVIFSLDEEKGQLQADIWKNEVIFDGAKINLVNIEDLVVSSSAPTIDEIPFFGVRMWLSQSDYRDGIRDGYFMDYGDDENLRIANMADIKWGSEIGQQMTDVQDNEEGTDSRDSYSYSPARKYLEVYRWEGWWVWENETGPENPDNTLMPAIQVCAWVAYRAKKVIKVSRLEDLNKDGKRSAVKFGFLEEPGRFYPMGLAEWVRHTQAELDAIHNQRLDAGLIFNVPFGFYKPTAGLRGVLNLRPGVLYPTPEPQSVNFPRSNWQPTFSMQEEVLVKRYGGEQAGLTDAAVGQPTTKRQSATEVAAMASALDLRTEDIVERLLKSLRELLYRVLSLYQQFGPPERIFRVGGEEGQALIKKFERDRLNGKILLIMNGNLSQINEQQVQQMTIEMFQLLMNEILIQTGIVTPESIEQALTLIFKAHKYKGVDIHKPDTPPMSDPPEIEEKQMFVGQKPKGPTLSENIAEHMQHHAMLAADARVMSGWTPQARQMLQEHIQATMQMQQAQQMMRQQQAAMAVQAAQAGAQRGIKPGQPGGQKPGNNTGPGTRAEGVAPPPGQGQGPTTPIPAQGQA